MSARIVTRLHGELLAALTGHPITPVPHEALIVDDLLFGCDGHAIETALWLSFNGLALDVFERDGHLWVRGPLDRIALRSYGGRHESVWARNAATPIEMELCDALFCFWPLEPLEGVECSLRRKHLERQRQHHAPDDPEHGAEPEPGPPRQKRPGRP